MKLDSFKILRGLLVKAYKKTESEVDELLQTSKGDDANEEEILSGLLETDKNRVSELSKPKTGQTFQDGFKKAKAEVLSEQEKAIKEAFGIESDAQGIDLINEVVAAKVPKDAQITEENIRKSPFFQAEERKHKKALAEATTAHEAKVKEIEAGYKKDTLRGEIRKAAIEALTGLNPVLSGNAKVAENQKNAYLQSFDSFEWEKNEAGQFIPMKDGKVAVDEHGHTIQFEDLAKGKAGDYFDFANNNGGANGNNGNQQGSAAGGKNQQGQQGQTPKGWPKSIPQTKSFDELQKYTTNQSIPVEERQQAMDAWQAENPGS